MGDDEMKIEKRLRYPQLSEVRLLPGTAFYDRQQDMNEFLLAQDDDSMLYNFRRAAGLPTLGAEPMRGWDAEECKLRGHTTGHYLSGLALAFAATGDDRYRDKLIYMIDGLAECQAAFAGRDGFRPGFLSAYSEEQFDLLEAGTPYPEIWAPYYTMDKIMSGLLDAYELADASQALDILAPMGDWIWDRLSRLTAEERNRMWDTYIAGEYGCMIVTLTRLYRLTGREEHLKAAMLFDNPVLFDQMAEGRDGLDTMHANQHIPQIMGALELYAETGEERYYDIASNFEAIVTGHHCYAIGGTGEQERFRAADDECSLLTMSTAESCASYNMMRLTTGLYRYTADPGLMAYFENTLFNHILASFSHRADGGTTYFMPLEPGSCRHYEGDDENSCCHGTGLETRYRYMTQIFACAADAVSGEEMLRVDLPVSARLDGDEKLSVTFTADGTLSVRADQDMKRRLAVRIPAWAGADETAFECPCEAEIRDGYLVTADKLNKGESVELHLPVHLALAGAASDPRYSYLTWGPYILAAISESKELMPPPDPCTLEADGDTAGMFASGGMRYMPVYMVDTEPMHLYFRQS